VTLDITSLGYTPATHTILWSTGESTASITTSVTGQIDVTVTDASGCSGTDAVNIVINDNPNISIPSQEICEGDPAAVFDAGAGFVSYSWTGTWTGSTQTCTTIKPGAFNVEVIDNNGCIANTSTTLTLNTLPAVTFNDRSICPGSNSVFDAGAGFTYLWQDSSTDQTYTSTTAETVFVTITDGNNCIAHDTALVSLQSALQVNIGDDQNLCPGEAAIYTVTNSGYTTASNTITWNTGAATDSINVNSTSQVVVVVTDQQGCIGTDTAEVVVSNMPKPNAQSFTICQGDPEVEFDAGAGYATYLWEYSDNASATTKSQVGTTRKYRTNIQGFYLLSVSDFNNCRDSVGNNLVTDDRPNVNLRADKSLCMGSSVDFDAKNPGATYEWHDGSSSQTFTANQAGSVYVTVTSTNGCVGSDTAIVTVPPGLTVDLGPDQFVCQGNSFTLRSDYDAVTNTVLWSTGESTENITVSATSTVYVEVSDAGGCAGFDTVLVTINPNPVVSLQDLVICEGDPAMSFDAGTGTGWSYAWSGDIITGTTLTNSSYSSSTAGTFNCTVTDANSCTGTSSATLVVNILPTVELGDTVKVCPGITSTFDAIGTGTIYQWNDKSSETASSYTTKDLGNVWVQVSSAAGCIANDTTYLAYLPALAVDFGNDIPICEGQSATLVSDRIGSGYSYDWNDGVNTTESITVSPLVSTTYELFVTDGGGCAGYDTIRVIVNLNPVINMPPQTICEGDAAVTFDAGYPGSSHVWSGDISVTGQTHSTNVVESFTVTVTDVNSCIGSGSSSLSVNILPAVQVNTASICIGDAAVIFTATSAGATDFLWSENGSGILATTSGTSAGDYTVQVTDANGCINTTTSVLTVNDLPIVSVNTESMCAGSTAQTFTATAPTANSYLWSENGSGTASSTSGSTSGKYTVQVTDANNCINTATGLLVVNVLPAITVNNESICIGSLAAVFTASSDSVAVSYSWDNGGGASSVSGSTDGDYVVTVTDENGCIGTGTGTLIVHPLPTPSMGDNRMCFGATPVSFTPGSRYVSYEWSGVASGQSTASVTDSTAGEYTVLVTDVNGCKDSVSATLTVNSNPVVYLGGDLIICEGESVIVGDPSFDGNPETLKWDISSSSQYLTLDSSGTYKLTVTDVNGCFGEDSMLLTVNPIPTFTKSADTVVCFETIGNLSLAVETNTRNDIVWEMGSTFQEIEIAASGSYVFTIITAATSCEITDTILVAERCTSTIFVPNAFSPNADGTNDLFFAEGVNIKDFQFYIFNRWGEEIFTADDIHKGWDGTYKGRIVQNDVYVWKMYYSTEEDYGGRKKRTQTGTVTVVR
ncbi:MAG: gliding motility-associated-like protein, partial [Glaciecola sp.]